MLGFLNSFILPALAAAALPILIHLFNKRKTKTVSFSSVRFLKMLESKRIRQLRIYEYLLILIRTLFIIALVLAFARPSLKSAATTADGASVTAVIVLDDSYSMQSYSQSLTSFQVAKQKLKQILATFSEDDKVFFLLPGQLSDSSTVLDLQKLDFIEALMPVYSYPDFNRTFARAAQIFKDQINLNRELYFISDYKINRAQVADSALAFCDRQSIRFYEINLTGKSRFHNLAIDTAYVSNQTVELNKSLKIKVRLRNYVQSDSLETRVHLFQGNQRLAMQNVRIAPGATSDVELVTVPKSEGLLPLRLELDNDDLMVDNFYYLNVLVSGKINILVVSSGLPYMLETAFQTLKEQSLLNIELAKTANFINTDLDFYDLLFLYDPTDDLSQNSYKLSAFSAQDKALIIVPGSRSDQNTLNRLLQALTGIEPFGRLKSVKNKKSFFSPRADWTSASLFSTLYEHKSSQLKLPEIYKYYVLQPRGQSWLRFGNDDPLITDYALKNSFRRCIVLSSSFEPEWSNLTYQGLFIPLLHRLFSIAARQTDSELMTNSGKAIKISLPQYFDGRDLKLILPDGSTVPINSQNEKSGLSVTVRPPLTPGHYQISQGEEKGPGFAVNFPAAELDRPYIDFSAGIDRYIQLDPNAEMAKIIRQTRRGRELWLLFAGLALLFLILEIVLVKKMEGKNERNKA